ncbi:hypothetical protein [Synechococcus sp. UW179B]|uniref:hypothetical protein n=1 Tax=Synechococcus sp. UW179B TaxID=2575516 RepID=UPI000E0F1A3A|nr:hypothetical protein [Synechococcus sp. UW179B]
MVSLDLLSSFDGMIWLQSGKKVGEIFEQHQTTISRNQKKCAQVFGIKLQKIGNNWQPQEDSLLLQLERMVHQTARLQGKSSLRLDANRWLDHSLLNPPPPGWIVSSAKNFSNQHSLECLEQRIVDASLYPSTALPLENTYLKEIKVNSKDNISVVVLQEHSNQERISNLINSLLK